MTGSTEPTSIDALRPADIAQKAETIGVQKTRLLRLMALAVLTQAFIALSAMFATTVLAGAGGVLPIRIEPVGAGVAFCLRIILAVLRAAEFVTEEYSDGHGVGRGTAPYCSRISRSASILARRACPDAARSL